MPSLAGAVAWLNSPPLTAEGLQGQGRPGRLLDVLLHQLPARDPLRPRLGREVQGPGPRRHRRARAGVRIREEPRQRAEGDQGPEDRLPGGDRQRLRDLARLRQPVLAGALLHRRAGPHPPPPFRRRRATTSPSASSSSCSPKPAKTSVAGDLVDVDATGARGGLRRAAMCARRKPMSATSGPRTSCPRAVPCTTRRTSTPSATPRLNEWGLVGDWTVGGEHASSYDKDGSDRLPLPCPRPASGAGTGAGRPADPFPRHPRRQAARRQPGHRR